MGGMEVLLLNNLHVCMGGMEVLLLNNLHVCMGRMKDLLLSNLHVCIGRMGATIFFLLLIINKLKRGRQCKDWERAI